jgi:Abnormal spindle-like microcephaly-assoc'd, ASPM-SPD-2-Hydin
MTRPSRLPRQSAVLVALLAAATLLALPASGSAAEATAVFAPGSQSFGSIVVGQHSGQQMLGLRDEGPQPIHVSGISIGGPAAGDFTIESNGCGGATLNSGESCFVGVSFAPTQGGLREATLEATHDGEGSASTAALSGIGLRQELTVSPAPLVFPTTTKNMSSELALTVSNQSDVGVTIFGTNVEGPGSGAFGTGGSNCGGVLSVGSSCTLDVRFSPQSEGEQRAFLHINAEGPGGGPLVELSGLAAPPQLQFEPGASTSG